MTVSQLIDWYCCSCADHQRPASMSRKQYNTLGVESVGRDGGTYKPPMMIIFDHHTVSDGAMASSSDSSSGGGIIQKLRTVSSRFRVVSGDWLAHTLQLGEYVHFNSCKYFALPTDEVHHPVVIRRPDEANERYIINDVVYYVSPFAQECHHYRRAQHRNTLASLHGSAVIQGDLNRDENVLRVGRIVAFDRSEVGAPVTITVRPLFFHRESLLDILRETRDIGERRYAVDALSSEEESEDDTDLSDIEDNPYDRKWRGDSTYLKGCVGILSDEYISVGNLCGRPVIMSEVAYNDLAYPRTDKTIYSNTKFFEYCYSGRAYSYFKRQLSKLLNTYDGRAVGDYRDSRNRGHHKASQDY
jgi:hypothetical protein